MAAITAPDYSRKVKISDGTTYSYVYMKSRDTKPTILFLHGFPSSSYDWRHQITDFAAAGYGVLVPDLLGYGGTDKPDGKENYRLRTMSGHIVELLELEGLHRVVAVGHDWGSLFLARIANWHPERFSALAFVSVGYIEPGPRIDIDTINSQALDIVGYSIFGYWPFFNSEDAADVIARNLDSFHTITYPADPWIWKTNIGPIGAFRKWIETGQLASRPSWQNAEEDETHRNILESGGLTGPLNWYKQELGGCNEADNETITAQGKQLHVPTLMILCKQDAVCPPILQMEGARQCAKDLTTVTLDCGHWVQLELRREFFSTVQAFLQEKLEL